MRKIRAISYGLGRIGCEIVKIMVEKGVDIVGAIDVSPDKVGKDLGEVAMLGRPLNVKISDDADAVLSQQEADIVVTCVFSEMKKMYPIYVKCIENGFNVISSGEEATYPWTFAPEITSKLDKLAKKHGVTITGSGNIDIFHINMPLLLTAGCSSIESIFVRAKVNYSWVGPVLAESYHIGETKEEFYKHINEAEKGLESELHMHRIFLESIVADLGLTIKKIEISDEPTIDDVDIEYPPLGTVIQKGLVTGKTIMTEIETEQGITLRGEYTGKVFKEGEKGTRECYIKGVPNLQFDCGDPDIRVTRGAQLVHRIPDVINCEPGYITLEKFPKLKFRAFPLQYYLQNP